VDVSGKALKEALEEGVFLIKPNVREFRELVGEDIKEESQIKTEAQKMVKSGRRSAQAVFNLTCLPYEAFFSLDATVRSVWRMPVTHKRLLEWNPSSGSARQSRTDLSSFLRTMWFAPVVAAAAGSYLTFSRPAALAVAGPVLCLWFFHPLSPGGSVSPWPARQQG